MMRVRDVMTTPPITVLDTDNLQTAMLKMGRNYRRLLVVNQNNVLMGIITDRDLRLAMNSPYILRERWQDEQLLKEIFVSNCMTPNPATIPVDAKLADAIDLMLTGRFSGLPVVDKENKPLGVVSVTDILKTYQKILRSQE